MAYFLVRQFVIVNWERGRGWGANHQVSCCLQCVPAIHATRPENISPIVVAQQEIPVYPSPDQGKDFSRD